MLLSLLDGRALPAGELAFSANVAPQTASGHLAKLVEGGLLSVESQGRHRYYRLAGPEVGTALEALGELAPTPRVRDREPEEVKVLRYARTCYNHLAGRLAVDIYAAMKRQGLLTPVNERQCELTALGRKWFAEIDRGHPPKLGGRQAIARLCLDWTERQHHLGGPAGMYAIDLPVRAKVDCANAWPGGPANPQRTRRTRETVGTRALTGSLRSGLSTSNLRGNHLPIVSRSHVNVGVAAHSRRSIFSSKQSGGLHQRSLAVDSHRNVF